MALCNFRKIDIGKLEGRRKLIDTFVNSVFLYDDHLKIIYNGKEKEEAVSLEELESSKISQGSQPNLTDFEGFSLEIGLFFAFTVKCLLPKTAYFLHFWVVKLGSKLPSIPYFTGFCELGFLRIVGIYLHSKGRIYPRNLMSSPQTDNRSRHSAFLATGYKRMP